jgi:hypothetical protein
LIKKTKCNIRNKRLGLITEAQKRKRRRRRRMRRLKVRGRINKKHWKGEEVQHKGDNQE